MFHVLNIIYNMPFLKEQTKNCLSRDEGFIKNVVSTRGTNRIAQWNISLDTPY